LGGRAPSARVRARPRDLTGRAGARRGPAEGRVLRRDRRGRRRGRLPRQRPAGPHRARRRGGPRLRLRRLAVLAGPCARPGRDGPDRRAAWLSGLDTAIRGLEADLAASEDPPPGAGRPPIAKGSLNSVRKGIEALGSLRRTLERRERAPWSQWAKLAAVTASKA